MWTIVRVGGFSCVPKKGVLCQGRNVKVVRRGCPLCPKENVLHGVHLYNVYMVSVNCHRRWNVPTVVVLLVVTCSSILCFIYRYIYLRRWNVVHLYILYMPMSSGDGIRPTLYLVTVIGLNYDGDMTKFDGTCQGGVK